MRISSRVAGSALATRLKDSWMQLAIFTGLMLVSIVIGYRPTGRLALFLVGGLGLVLFAIVAFRNMQIALTLLVLTSATLGITINTGRATPVPLGMVLVIFLSGIWLVRMLVVNRRIRLAASPMNKPFLAFLAFGLISWLIGAVVWNWRVPVKDNFFVVQAGQYAIFACSVAAMLLTANHPLNEKYRKLWSAFIILAGLTVVSLEITTGANPLRNNGMNGSMLMWPFVLLWAQLLYQQKLSLPLKVIGWLSLPIWAYWAYNHVFLWKGGWMPALFALGLLFALKSKRFFLISLILGALVFSYFFFGESGREILLANEYTSGSTVRPLYWYDVIRMTKSSPLFGLGPASYSLYWQDPTFVPQSRVAAGWDRWNAWGYAPPSHNMWVDVYAQTGLLGLFLFSWGIMAAVRFAYLLFLSLSPGFDKGYVAAILSGVISLCVSSFFFADWMVPYVYNITITGFSHSVYTWLLIGTLVPVSLAVKDRSGGSTA